MNAMFLKKYFPALFAFLFLLTANVQAEKTVVINEICASNSESYTDEDHDNPDWIELYNSSNQAVNLKNWRIKDSKSALGWILPDTTLEAGKYLILCADDKNRSSSGKYFVEAAGKGGVGAIAHDYFRYQYLKASGDFEMEMRVNTMKDFYKSTQAGIMIRESLDQQSRYAAIAALNPERSSFSFMIRDVWETHSGAFKFSYFDYPFAWLKLQKQGDSIIAYKKDYANRWEKLYTAYLPMSSEFYVGVSFFSAEQTALSSAVLSDLKFNTQPYKWEDLTIAEISTLVPGRSFYLKELHCNFKLNKGGDEVQLLNAAGATVDIISFDEQKTDISYGRYPDGGNELRYFAKTTPEKSNAEGLLTIACTAKAEIPGGFFNDAVQTLIQYSQDSADAVYYTLNGSEPTQENGIKYTGNKISVFETSVLKMKCYKENYLPSETVSETYFINEVFNLPTISISGDSTAIFDEETGLFADGNEFGLEEVPVNLEYWENPNEVKSFSAGAGMTLHGGITRAFDQKALRFYARSKYGNRSFKYPFFGKINGDNFDKLVLRNGGTDWGKTFIRDEMYAVMTENINSFYKSPYKPVSVYVNGKYWGMFSLRERIDEELLEEKFDVSSESVNLIELDDKVKSGNAEPWLNLIDTLKNMDLSVQTEFDKIAAKIDLDNIIDYTSAEIYSGNFDWPWNNIKHWNSVEKDGKWRWILFDTDWGFGQHGAMPDLNTIAASFQPDSSTYSMLIYKLLGNNAFKLRYLNRFADLLNSEFTVSRQIRKMDSLAEQIRPEIPRHHLRWEKSAVNWEAEVEFVKNYMKQRPDSIMAVSAREFNLQGVGIVELANSNTQGGYIELNSLIIKDGSWKGKYFKDVPVRVKAVAKEGYAFRSWVNIGNSAELNIMPGDSIYLKAVFEKVTRDTFVVINEIMYKPSDSKKSDDWFELYNAGTKDMNIGSWIVQDDNDDSFYLIPPGQLLKAGDYLVICKEKSDFHSAYPNVKNFIGNLGFGLGTSDMIRLYDSKARMIDSVSWTNKTPWYPEADGTGNTLELLSADLTNSIPESWRVSLNGIGTPGEKNSNYLAIEDNTHIAGNIYPNPAKNIITFSFDILNDYYIDIFNSNGLLVNKLKGSWNISWNLKDANGNSCPAGVYYYSVKDSNYVSHGSFIILK